MEVSVDIWKSQKKAGGLPAAGISISRYRDRGRKDSGGYRSEALKQQLEACSSIEEIFDMISLEYKDYYFLEISALLHDDQTLYSHLLKKTMDTAGITDYISAHNYEYLIKFADEETQQYITQKLTQ